LAPDKPPPHPFTGFFIQYPDDERDPPERGLVSTISNDPPMLNWIYCSKEDYSLRYGNRTQSIKQVVGPWDWTEDETQVMLEDWEGFLAVRVNDEESKAADGLKWKVYFDRDDDGLKKGNLVNGRPRLEVSLVRRCLPEEIRRAQEEAADNKMQVKSTGDLKTKFEAPGSGR
jgi:hypothetical protein